MGNVYYEEEIPEPACYERLEDYKMPRITNEQIYQKMIKFEVVLLGIPESEDMGLYGECKDMKKLLKEMNGTVKSDHVWIGALRWGFGFLVLFVLGTITAGKVIGVW